jgi:hypothetical protein
MKQAYFASLDRQHASQLPQRGSGPFTSTATHLPLGLPGEMRPCASSAGVTFEQLAPITPLVGLEPPASESVASLSLLHTPGAGRFLSHGAVAQASNGHARHAFSHVLLDIPATLDAHQAIMTWGSEQWQRSVADGLGQLDEALIPPVSVTLNDDVLVEFLSDEKHRELLHYLFCALIQQPAEMKIFVAAPADVVATCLYGITRALPANTLEAFTFTTFTHDPLSSPAKLVGTIPTGDDKELPPSCHDGAGVGINFFTGTKTSIDTEIFFVDFALQVLASGNFGPLDDFRSTWQRLALKDITLLDVVYRLGRGPNAISKEEAIKALQDQGLAAWVAPRTEYQDLFLNWALDDVDFATATFPRVVTVLRQKPDHLNRMASIIREAGLKAVMTGDLTKTRSSLEVLLPMVSPASGQGIWGELLQSMKTPGELSWEMQSYLLPKLARLRPLTVGQTAEEDISRWLNVPADKLGNLLGLSLSQGHQVAASLAALQQPEQIPAVAVALVNTPTLAMTVLGQLHQSNSGKSLAPELFAQYVAKLPERGWLSDVLQMEPLPAPTLLNRYLGIALDHGSTALEPVAFVKRHGNQVLEQLGGQGNLDRLAHLLLGGQAGDYLSDPSLKSFFVGLDGKSGISGPVEERLKALLLVDRYLSEPTVRPDRLDEIAKALQLQPSLYPASMHHRLLRAALSSMGNTTFQDELVGLLLNWGPVMGGPSALYRECLRLCQENKLFWKNPDQIQAFLAVALDGTPSHELNSQTEGLEAEAYSLVENMVRKGGKKSWDEMNARLTDWPRAAKRQWQFLSQAVMPSNGRGVGRDLSAGAIGAVAMAVVFVVLRWLQVF